MAIITSQRSEAQILRDGRQRLNNIGLNSTNSTSTAVNLLELNALELSNMWSVMNDLLRRNFISTSYGESLDKIGELLQEPRRDAKRALDLSTSNVYITLDTTFASNITDLLTRYFNQNDLDKLDQDNIIDDANNPGQINLPSSLTFSSQDETVSYNTVNPLVLTNTQLTDYTPVIANGVGSSFNVGPNALTKHNIAGLFPALRKISEALKVSNKMGIRSGSGLESDENYRFRLANKVVSAVSGNESAIRKAVLSVPGVVDMSLIRRSHGNGTFTIFPKTEDPIVSDGIINAVQESVSFVKSIGDISFVEVPKYLAVSLRLELRFSPGADKNSIFSGARLAVMDYINNLSEGGEIVINEVIQRVMSIDDKIIDMQVSSFGFGEYDRTTGVVTNFTPLRLLNQQCDWNERFYTNSSLCSICQSGDR